jgi:hypothetical protein
MIRRLLLLNTYSFFHQKKLRLSAGVIIALLLGMNIFLELSHKAQASESLSRTESNCTIGMSKGDVKAECQVPIPHGCTVAQFPGYSEPWADISKGGATSCHFDDQHTDWETTIVGICHKCNTDQCTGRFIVMFNCADNVPPANPASPRQK